MNQHFEDFVEDLRTTHGENLRSVILYGSAVTGDYVPFESDYNILVALEQIRPEDLRNAHGCVREWVKLGHPPPVYFTVSEVMEAGDVFPIEIHFMERARKVLYGEDVLAHVEISDANLRHQTEYELRSKLLQLRNRYIEVSNSPEKIIELMADSIWSFAADFRAVLLLNDVEPPLKLADVVTTTGETLGIKGRSFERIVAIRENERMADSDEVTPEGLITEYFADIEAVIDTVDILE